MLTARNSITQVDRLIAGEVGYLAASIKSVADARVGDTITCKKNGATKALPGLIPQSIDPLQHHTQATDGAEARPKRLGRM